MLQWLDIVIQAAEKLGLIDSKNDNIKISTLDILSTKGKQGSSIRECLISFSFLCIVIVFILLQLGQ